MNKAFLLMAAMLVLPAAVHAAVSGMPSSITFHDAPEEMTFSISNTSSLRQVLEIEMFVPVSYEFVSKPAWVGAGESTDITIRLVPRPDLIGVRYESMVRITLGSSVEEKTIAMNFESADNSNESAAASAGSAAASAGSGVGSAEGIFAGGAAGFASLVDLSSAIGSALTTELLADVVLAVIALALLAAFIFRFMDMAEAKRG